MSCLAGIFWHDACLVTAPMVVDSLIVLRTALHVYGAVFIAVEFCDLVMTSVCHDPVRLTAAPDKSRAKKFRSM